MLIDCSYFTAGPRHILNATLGTAIGPNANEVNGAIEAYIAEYQEEFLTLALGSTLSHKVNSYLVCIDEGDKVKSETYEAVCDQLKNAFADYVFFHIMRYSNTQQTITGLVRLKCANEYVSTICKQVNIWNAMVKKNKRFLEWASSDECALSGIAMDSELLTLINQFNL